MPHDASFADRHLEMAEDLRDWLAEALPPPTFVDRGYAPDVGKVPPTGKLVWVHPLTEEEERLSRHRVLTEYGFAVAVAERYGPALQPTGGEPIPKEWVDERCGWVRANVYTPLNDRVKKRERLIQSAWPQTCRIVAKYDEERLVAGMFWSRIDVTFREEREA